MTDETLKTISDWFVQEDCKDDLTIKNYSYNITIRVIIPFRKVSVCWINNSSYGRIIFKVYIERNLVSVSFLQNMKYFEVKNLNPLLRLVPTCVSIHLIEELNQIHDTCFVINPQNSMIENIDD
jgi:hypothetical protein